MTMMDWAPSDWKKDESYYLFSGAIPCSGSNVYIVENPDSILSEVSLTLSRNTVMIWGQMQNDANNVFQAPRYAAT